jgi:hypothetical protein
MQTSSPVTEMAMVADMKSEDGKILCEGWRFGSSARVPAYQEEKKNFILNSFIF